MLRHLNSVPTLPPRIIVVGAAGFVGGALVKRLAQRGASVVAIGRRDLDLLAPDSATALAAMLRPDDTFVAVAAQAPCKNVQMLTDNVKMIAAMLEAVARSPVAHVVNISSDAVYADSLGPLSEEAALAPDTLHGVMHLAREAAFRTEVHVPLAILRPSLLYGATDPHNGYGPNRFRRQANEGKDIVLFGKGEERRDHVFIDDVAELITRVIEWRSEGTLNVATGYVHSFREIADLVVASANREVAIKESQRNGAMPHNGFRPFDIAACHASFPDFAYTPLAFGIATAQAEEFGPRIG
jgi:nucleoside-diphosphate-sugar epimerase